MLMRTLPAGRGRSSSGRPASSSRASPSSPPRCRSARAGSTNSSTTASASSPIRTASGCDLWSRNGRDRSGDFVAITDAVRALPASRVVLDGEAVAHCLDGLPGFNRLLSGDGQASACLYAFDLYLA